MWELIEYNQVESVFIKISESDSPDELIGKKDKSKAQFVLFTGKLSAEPEGIDALVQQVNAINGCEIRLTLPEEGKSINTCYCVHYPDGSRWRECHYCNEHGYCWWVNTGISC